MNPNSNTSIELWVRPAAPAPVADGGEAERQAEQPNVEDAQRDWYQYGEGYPFASASQLASIGVHEPTVAADQDRGTPIALIVALNAMVVIAIVTWVITNG